MTITEKLNKTFSIHGYPTNETVTDNAPALTSVDVQSPCEHYCIKQRPTFQNLSKQMPKLKDFVAP